MAKDLKPVNGTYSLPYTIEAEWTTYLVFSVLFLPLSIITILVALQNPSTWQGLLFPIVLWVPFMLWAKSLKVTITDDSISYKTLFSKTSSIKFNQIKSIGINIGIKRNSKQKGYYSFNIVGKNDELLSINIKPFGKRDIAILADSIVTKVPKVEIDDFTKKLTEGEFKAIVHAGIRKMWQIFLLVLFISLMIILINSLL